jgi:LPS-assembly protein
MTRLGPGLGGEFRYQNKGSEGSVSAYTIPLGAQSLVTNIDHRQSVGSGRLGVQLDLQWNSIYSAPDATVYNLRSQYDLSDLRGSTSVSYTRSGSEFPESRVASESIGLRLDRTLSRTERLSADTSLNTSESPSDLYRDAEVRFRYTRQFPNFEGRVDYQRTIPIGETEFAGGTGDRVPVLTLSSDSSRLFGRKFGTEWPVRTEISVGEFGRTAGDNVQRAAFSVSLNKPDRRNQRFRFDYNAQFRQGIYSDDTAQYVVGGGFTSSYRLGTRSSLNLRYNYSRPEGYTPLSLDRAGQVHLASLDAGVEPLNYTYFGLQTGYDFFRVRQSQTGWQQLAVRAEVNRGREFSLRSLASYDTFSSRWQSVRLDLSLAKNYLLTVGARYDGLSSRWSNVNVYLNGLRWAKPRFDVTASYNGFTTQLDAIQVATVYDLHCAEAVFLYSNFRTGFRSGQEFSFFIRLKALPSDYAFGVGRRGQPLGTSTGIDY